MREEIARQAFLAQQLLEREDGGEELVRARLNEHDVEVTGIRRVDPSLEDVFIALVMEEGGARVD